jgi:hypothetical protein
MIQMMELKQEGWKRRCDVNPNSAIQVSDRFKKKLNCNFVLDLMSRLSTNFIPMSQIIANDAPLLSPISPSTDMHFNYLDSVPLYYIPPSPPSSVSSNSHSPIPAARMLKSSNAENEQLCLPTHQVFDFPRANVAESSKSERPPISIDTSIPPALSKRSAASPAPSVTKKPRATAERINTKDFVPPDVSGLSKREARLVKNRAAAFLSRQRKREEFEFMEVYVLHHHSLLGHIDPVVFPVVLHNWNRRMQGYSHSLKVAQTFHIRTTFPTINSSPKSRP